MAVSAEGRVEHQKLYQTSSMVEFLVFNLICQLLIVPSDGVNRGDLHKIFLILSCRRHIPLFKGYYGSENQFHGVGFFIGSILG